MEEDELREIWKRVIEAKKSDLWCSSDACNAIVQDANVLLAEVYRLREDLELRHRDVKNYKWMLRQAGVPVPL